MALAETIKEERALIGTDQSYWKFLNDTMAKKREEMFELATEAGLNPIKPEGGYFMVLDLSELGMHIVLILRLSPLEKRMP